MLRELAAVATEFLFVSVDSVRGEDPAGFVGMTDVPGRVVESVDVALKVAASPRVVAGVRQDAERDTQDGCAPRALVAGSLFLVGEALGVLTE
jgi:folylpolyglutamate synthase/dihydropteroate synthase